MDVKDIERSIIKKYKSKIFGRFLHGVKEFEMVADGDKIAVCISGGKDSFLLAKCMQELKKHSKYNFDLEFIVMDPGYEKKNLDLIKENLKKLEIDATIYDSNIFNEIKDSASMCYLCARKRNLSTESFILSIAVLQGFFLSFEYFFKDLNLTLNSFIELIILVFIYYFISFVILYIFKIIEKVRELNKSIELLEKDKMIKESLFKLTHEIKNPLAVIKGYLDMFNIDNKEKSLKYLNIIREEANRSLNIITDFLEFNKIKIVKTEIDLNLLLEDVYDSFKIILNRKNIKLIYNDREDEEIYFDGDYERLKQVLINVLKNSVEAIKDKGKVEISSNIYKRHIDIIIEDDGIGMSEDTLKQLKTMFFTTKLNGSGLGVCLSNEIIKAHNGELIYTSKEGVGTKVTIRLPK